MILKWSPQSLFAFLCIYFLTKGLLGVHFVPWGVQSEPLYGSHVPVLTALRTRNRYCGNCFENVAEMLPKAVVNALECSHQRAGWSTHMLFMAIVIIIGFAILSFNLQGGLERVTKYMMAALLGLMVVLAVHSMGLSGAKEGLCFYLLPDFSKITPSVVVGAMNQAFFTLSLGIGSMAIFGSYIGKNRTLLGESVNIIILDTFVAITAGLIIFPACFSFNLEVGAGAGTISLQKQIPARASL